jgi:hypothetical protein
MQLCTRTQNKNTDVYQFVDKDYPNFLPSAPVFRPVSGLYYFDSTSYIGYKACKLGRKYLAMATWAIIPRLATVQARQRWAINTQRFYFEGTPC